MMFHVGPLWVFASFPAARQIVVASMVITDFGSSGVGPPSGLASAGWAGVPKIEPTGFSNISFETAHGGGSSSRTAWGSTFEGGQVCLRRSSTLGVALG